MTEHDIQNLIRINLSELGVVNFRINVGRVRTPDGRFFDTGVPKGFSDIFGVMPDGRALFIEVKKPGGRVRPEQQNFINLMSRKGAVAFIAYSVDEVTERIKNELYG